MTLWVERGLRAVVTATFLWAGAAKAIDPAGFYRDVMGYRLVSVDVALIIAAYLPWLEMIAAVGLWFEAVRKGAQQILLVLTGIFLAAILAAWGRGLEVSCGCFGESGRGGTNYGWMVARDLALLGALVGIAWLCRRRRVVGCL